MRFLWGVGVGILIATLYAAPPSARRASEECSRETAKVMATAPLPRLGKPVMRMGMESAAYEWLDEFTLSGRSRAIFDHCMTAKRFRYESGPGGPPEATEREHPFHWHYDWSFGW